jgi:putative tryptophan/tyrosine transport system substrate-binding protein
MHKRFTLFLVTTLFCATAAFFVYQQSTHIPGSTNKTYKRIALFSPATHPAMTEIEKGVKETMSKEGKQLYSFDSYNANGDKTLLRAQAEEMVIKKYDAIIPVGASCTQTIYELSSKKQSNTPIIFTAVEDPNMLGIDQSVYPITGITDVPNLQAQLEQLLEIKPAIKTVLLVYNPAGSPGLEKRKNTLEQLLNNQDITLKTVSVFNANEIMQKVPSHLENVDVVWIFTDHTTVAGLDSLITLCNKYQITLYASDLNSAKRGAAIAFGVSEYSHGQAAARKAFLILDQNNKASDIPISNLGHEMVLLINPTAAKTQNLEIPEDKLTVLMQQNKVEIT